MKATGDRATGLGQRATGLGQRAARVCILPALMPLHLSPCRSCLTVRRLGAVCVVGWSASVARGADWLAVATAERDAAGSAQVAGALTERWTLTLAPSVWAPGADGDLEFGGSGEFDLERFQVDQARASGMSRIDARKGDLSIHASGFVFGFDEEATRTDAAQTSGGLTFAAGDPARVRFDLASAEVTIGTRVWERELPGPNGGNPVRLGVDAFGGMRVYWLDALVSAPGGGARSGDGFWAEPIVGATLNIDLQDHAGFYVTLSGGGMPIGDHTSSSFDIVTGIQWRPLGGRLGVQFGWRQLVVNLENGDGADEVEYDGALAGLFGSLVVRF